MYSLYSGAAEKMGWHNVLTRPSKDRSARLTRLPLPDKVQHRTNSPDSNQNSSLHRREYCASNNNEAADKSKQDRNEDKWLYRPIQLRLAETQDDSAQHGKEEECILCKSIESEQDAHIAKEDVDCRDKKVQDQCVAKRSSAYHHGSCVLGTDIGDSP